MADSEEPSDRPPRRSGWVILLRILIGVFVAGLLLAGLCIAVFQSGLVK